MNRLIVYSWAAFVWCGCTLCANVHASTDYWVWHPKVHLSRVLADAGRLYLLQGELLQRRGTTSFARRGFSPPTAAGHPIVLVYRLEAMEWSAYLQHQVARDIEAFEVKANAVWGIQIDFDASTRNLDRYGQLLGEVRAGLPARYRLSVTGLMDWASQGRLEDLNALQGVADEIVFQTYQGMLPVKDHDRYLWRLSGRRLSLPFRLGLVEHGQYDQDALAAVSAHPQYRGTVIFLLPDVRR